MVFLGKTFFVLGLGKAGVSAVEFIIKKGGRVFAYDDNIEKAAVMGQTVLLGAEPIANKYAAFYESDIFIVSPGVKADNEFIVLAKKEGKEIWGELELGILNINCPVLGITGTNGKTTVTQLVSHILSAAHLKNVLCGNNDTPITAVCGDCSPETFAVTEVSSFMLEHTKTFRPRIAALLNLTPDHLNHHKNFEEYRAAKLNIFAGQTSADYAVLNFDDPLCRTHGRGNTVYFSSSGVCDGAYIKSGKVYYFDEEMFTLPQNFKKGHERQNALAAVCFAKILGISNEDIQKGLTTFIPDKHRIELVRVKDGVAFYDDSKGTNIDAAIKAITSCDGMVALILGGSDKGYDFDPLFTQLPEKVHFTAFIGATAEKLTAAAKRAKYKNYVVCNSLEEAVAACFAAAVKRGGCVLLSPAAASFDMFKNYAERGERFREIVEKL